MADPTNNDTDKNRQRVRSYAKYSGMAMQMAIIILLGVFAGKKLDEVFQTEPFILVVMALLSVGLALYTTLKDLI